MSELLDKLAPPGYQKPNLGAIYEAIDALISELSEDELQAIFNIFPLFASDDALTDHAAALRIPKFSYDTTETFRARVAAAAYFLEREGSRGSVKEGLNEIVIGRYELREQFLKLFVGVDDMTDEDRSRVREYLEATIDPNILLTIADLFAFIENSSVTESLNKAIVFDSADAVLGGWRYDGRLRFDHGKSEYFDGSRKYGGVITHTGYSSKKGTIDTSAYAASAYNGSRRYGSSIKYDGFQGITGRPLPSVAAHYDSADDILNMAGRHQLTDQVVIAIRYDGRFIYSGINYGAEVPVAVDPAMQMTTVRRRRYDGRLQYAFSTYGGALSYNGQKSYFDGPGYHGDVRVAEGVL